MSATPWHVLGLASACMLLWVLIFLPQHATSQDTMNIRPVGMKTTEEATEAATSKLSDTVLQIAIATRESTCRCAMFNA